ncbi:prokaryotic E2 ligase family D protein [Desertibacillus haloalkaliphilus]|uniref:prokaryotic E2 ligase family D protein n=1 Tax=Desertibacillus haloalkaliphilus TaxID=1328930 RepID=UPI001C276B8F|nr:prokaryotic E2 ligase family D protein [Desertibacillus haloalkaliphilus]MBU8908080.1 prokaryotic E2 ligase family D protein [Desertibacillus haloalkaliphilus]
MNEFVVRIKDNLQQSNQYVEIEEQNQHGVSFDRYKMTLSDFVRAIQGSIEVIEEEKGDTIPTPILPKNCIKHIWTNYNYDTQSGVQDVFIEIPKKRWDISCFDTRMMDVGFPKMVFRYRVDETMTVRFLWVVAVKDTTLTPQTEVFHFPFSNVGSAGKVCMGGNIFPPIQDIQQLQTLHNYFFQVPFSSDHYSAARNLSGIQDIREMFKSVQDKDFPDTWLQPSGSTLQRWMNG